MPRVKCACVECKHNKDYVCKADYISMSEGHVHTRHQGYKQVWTCNAFEMSEDAKQLLEELKRIEVNKAKSVVADLMQIIREQSDDF